LRQAGSEIDFHFDPESIDAVQCSAVDLRKHKPCAAARKLAKVERDDK
jgi:hypothetical protein